MYKEIISDVKCQLLTRQADGFSGLNANKLS